MTIVATDSRLGQHLTGAVASADIAWVQLFDYREGCPSVWSFGSLGSRYLGEVELEEARGAATIEIPTDGKFFFKAYWQAHTFPTISTCQISGGFVPAVGNEYVLTLGSYGDYCTAQLTLRESGEAIPVFDVSDCQDPTPAQAADR